MQLPNQNKTVMSVRGCKYRMNHYYPQTMKSIQNYTKYHTVRRAHDKKGREAQTVKGD